MSGSKMNMGGKIVMVTSLTSRRQQELDQASTDTCTVTEHAYTSAN